MNRDKIIIRCYEDTIEKLSKFFSIAQHSFKDQEFVNNAITDLRIDLNEISTTHPTMMYIATKTKGPLVVGQKVWAFTNGKYYIAEDILYKSEYKIILGNEIDIDEYGDILTPVLP